MKFVERGCDVSELEKDVKNKWRWAWLEEKNDSGVKFGEWCQKVPVAGTCFCVPCGKTLLYSNRGKKALSSHADDSQHAANLKSVRQTCTLDGATKTTSTKSSVSEGTAELKSVLCCFLAEHCLPLSLSQALVDLSKRLSADKVALSALSFCRTCATYTMTHGVATTMKEDLSEKLRRPGTFFSLNVDEATNNNNDKIVNVLVQYFDQDLGKVVIDHLGSKVVNLANSKNIFDALTSILNERDLGWESVVSVLMDNCNAMKGKIGGVETLIRKEQTSLLDISGDTIYIVHTSASHMFQQFDQKFLPLQELAGDLHYDIEESSPKASYLFSTIQEHLYGKKAKRLIRPIPNRFLQMQQVADRLHELMDALTVFYFAFLTPEEKRQKSGLIKALFEKYATPEQSQSKINAILEQQGKQYKVASKPSTSRKEKIILYLFQRPDQLTLAVETYRGILDQFSRYVKLFQWEKPLIHKLHAEMFIVVRRFFSLFLDPVHIPEHDSGALLRLDPENRDLHLRDRQLCVGEFCRQHMKECLRNQQKNGSWLPSFFTALRCGYIAGAKGLQKLPLTNRNITNLSALDPGLQRSAATASSLMSLAEKLPNVIPPESLGKLDIELKDYTCDSQITQFDVDETAPDFQIDTDWWVPVFELSNRSGMNQEQRYQMLSILVKALLSIFSGPIVEGSFNIMGDIMEEDRAALLTENYEAYAIIKQRLKSTKATAVTMKVSEKMKRSVLRSYQKYQESVTNRKKEKSHLQSRHKRTIGEASSSTPTPSSSKSSASSLPIRDPGQASSKKAQSETFCTSSKLPPSASRTSTSSAKETSAPASSKLPPSASRTSTSSAKETSAPASSKLPPSASRISTSSATETSAPASSKLPPSASRTSTSSAKETSAPVSRKAYFQGVSERLRDAAKSSYEQLQKLACEAEKYISKMWPVNCFKELEASKYKVDSYAADLYPTDAPPLTPVKIYGDGNCLPRSASLLVFGNEEGHVEMRARIAIELAVNEDFYLSDFSLRDRSPGAPEHVSWTTHYASYSDHLPYDETLNADRIRNVFRKEVLEAVVPGTYMGMWPLHAVCSILCTPIQSVYPQYGGHTVRDHLHRKIFPCMPSTSSVTSNSVPSIMWSRLLGKDLPEAEWRPNHFVVCLPGDKCTTSLKRKPAQDIRSFFAKTAKF